MMNLDDFQGRMFDLQETDLASPDRVARVSPKRLFATPQHLKCKGETNLTELNSSETETTRAKYDEEQGWRDRGGREGREAAINLRTSPCTPPVEKRETTGRHSKKQAGSTHRRTGCRHQQQQLQLLLSEHEQEIEEHTSRKPCNKLSVRATEMCIEEAQEEVEYRPPRFCTREQCTEPITFSLQKCSSL